MDDLAQLLGVGEGQQQPQPPPASSATARGRGRLLQPATFSGPQRRLLTLSPNRDAPIPAASVASAPPSPARAPAPVAAPPAYVPPPLPPPFADAAADHASADDDGGGGGQQETEDDGEGMGYVPWNDLVTQRRREEVARLLGLDQQLRDWAVAARPDMAEALAPPPPEPAAAPGLTLQSKCFLCSTGVRSKDAGTRGTRLFFDLLKMLAQLADRGDYWLTDFTTRFFVDRFLPLFLSVGVTPPVFYPGAIYEHFSTMLHTLNPVQFLRLGIRELAQEMEVLKSGQRERRNGRATDDARVAAEVTKKRKLQLEFYSMKPSQMAFYDAAIDGDWTPSATASIAPAHAVLAALGNGEIMPSSFEWLADYLASAEGGGGPQ